MGSGNRSISRLYPNAAEAKAIREGLKWLIAEGGGTKRRARVFGTQSSRKPLGQLIETNNGDVILSRWDKFGRVTAVVVLDSLDEAQDVLVRVVWDE